MPESRSNSCAAYREQLTELLIESRTPVAGTPLAVHLASCPVCRSFWGVLTGLKPGLALPDLYTPGLRYRTLKRLADEAEPVNRRFLSFMIPISLLSLLSWFAVPLVGLAWLVDYWLASPWLALLFSMFLMTSLGFLVGCLAFVTLTHGNAAERLKGQMKDLLEEFHA